MVIESIINPIKAERRPWQMIFFGLFYTIIGVFLALWVFEEHASLVFVFFTVMAFVPLIYSTISLEEKKDVLESKESILLFEHSRALSFFGFMFLGVTIGCVLCYVLLPEQITNLLFQIQTETIININSHITGDAVNSFNLFTAIFFNNLKVLIFCILFAFVYGVGAIFILVWNASVIGTAIGNVIRSNVINLANNAGLVNIGNYFHIISFAFLKYAIHGIPEILAYFIGGLAGGIISIAVIRHDVGTNKFETILVDAADMLVISIVFLIIAAGLEVYITPLIG